MKKKSTEKPGKTSAPTPKKKNASSSPPRERQARVRTSAAQPASSIPGLTRKTRPELIALAESMRLPVGPKDRRIDLIEKIRSASGTAIPGKRDTQSPIAPSPPLAEAVSHPVPRPEILPSPPPPLPASQARTAAGWKDFLDIPYEPVHREKGHHVTILSIAPTRIIAFFAVDRNLDRALTHRIDTSGLVLKIRDITGAVFRGDTRGTVETDHVFDIMTGMAERWYIPLWSSNRWIEAWLGYYDNGTFNVLARSKRIRTPLGGPSPRTGSLFHLKESLLPGYFPMEEHWRNMLSRSRIKLPTSHEIPSSHYKP